MTLSEEMRASQTRLVKPQTKTSLKSNVKGTMYSQCLTLETTTTTEQSTNKQDNLPSTIWGKNKAIVWGSTTNNGIICFAPEDQNQTTTSYFFNVFTHGKREIAQQFPLHLVLNDC